MSIPAGAHIGAFEVTSLLGRGGFGEVYRARDPKLKRDVAIKILPAEFGSDADRIKRFEREAEMLASLNHPNIAHIYSIEETAAGRCIVMELVEGETLQDRLAHGSVRFAEALPIWKQIAEALEVAHEHDVIHRDIKPANIMIAADGTAKVLDFGLAKVVQASYGKEAASDSPTVTAASAPGVLLGTVPYMSPEQARGLELEKRTDIWSFGCLMYEMLTGRAAFAGNTISDVIASILGPGPDWDLLPGDTPFNIRRLIQRCLEKDLQRRIRDIGDARLALEDVSLSATSMPPTPRANRKTTIAYMAAIVVSLLAGAGIAWNLKPPGDAPDSVARFAVPVPASIGGSGGYGSTVVVSPDGKYLIFSSPGGTASLLSHSISSGETKILPQTEGATNPFFSPDGQWVAFFSGGKLRKIPAQGGVPVILCDAPSPRGGFWTDTSTILLSPLARGSGIVEVSADGGTAKPITALDSAKGETSHRLPDLLAASSTLLFASYGATYLDVSIVAQSMKTGRRQTLIEGASQPHYVSTDHLLYVQPKLPGVVFAVPFDARNVRITGTPVAVVQDVLTERGDSASWSLSRSGTLVYAPGGLHEEKSNLVFVSRNGVATPVGSPPERQYGYPRLSPDGRQLLVSLAGVQTTVWLYDLASHAFNRMSFEGNSSWAVWSADGTHVSYASNRAEPWRLYSKPIDGSGLDELLLPRDSGDQQPDSWSPDGKFLLFQDALPETGQDIWILSAGTPRQAKPFLQTRASEVDAQFSPDGRWVAYASNESGRYEVYVVPFPVPGGKWQISTEGGREPLWAHNGHELFFRNGDKMMAVSVVTAPTFRTGGPQVLFQGRYVRTSTVTAAYDVARDDQHFLMVQPSEDTPANTQFNIILNWLEDLKQRVPLH